MTPSNQDRWREICALFERGRGRNSDEHFTVGRLAIHARQQLAEALGCPDDYVTHYKYKHGALPLYDSSEAVKTGWDSISQNEEFLTFGIGVKLEIAENTFPKSIFVYPFSVKLDRKCMSVTSTMFSAPQRICFDSYADDLNALGERMYEGLKDALSEWADDGAASPAMGFAARIRDES